MIDDETLTRLRQMRLGGMADALVELGAPGWPGHLSAVEVVRMAVDREWERRRNAKLSRLRRGSCLAQPYADLADIRIVPGREIDTEQIARLATGQYVNRHEDIILQGPTGAGKTFLACALANKACQDYKTVLYLRADELFDRLTIAEKTDNRSQVLKRLVSLDLLIIDDWFLTAPTRDQVKHLHALIDRRTRAGSTIFCTSTATLEVARPHGREDPRRRDHRPHHRRSTQSDRDLHRLHAPTLRHPRVKPPTQR